MPPFNPPRGVLGPFGPKVGNGVENEFPGPSGPGVQRVRNRVEKVEKELKFPLFDSFSTLFLTFWTAWPEGPENSFSTPFPTLGPKGKVFGQDIPGTSGTQTSGYPGQELYASGLFLLF